MGFDFNSFDNLMQMFACRRGYARVRTAPEVMPVAVVAETQKVIFFSVTSSQFVDVKTLRPRMKPAFVGYAADKRVKPVTAVSSERGILKLKAKMAEAIAEEPKPKQEGIRTVLKLKTKIDLPAAPTRLGKNSTTEDFTAALRAELRQMKLEEAGVAEPKRHPLSSKSWSELMAETETFETKKPKHNFDLAAAMKAEAQALTARGVSELAEAPRLRTAFEPKLVSQTAQPQRKSVAKMHRVA